MFRCDRRAAHHNMGEWVPNSQTLSLFQDQSVQDLRPKPYLIQVFAIYTQTSNSNPYLSKFGRPNQFITLQPAALTKIFLDLVRQLNPLNSVGGNAYEFSTSKFPQVTALLNPQQHSILYPVTSVIVQEVIRCLTVESLPEQIGILYVMCHILRWIITGSEEDYYAMPDWLRPGAAQLCTAHPIWVDIMPWPKSRDRLCRDAHYHDKFEALKGRANETISVNWPYKPEDTLIQMSPTEFAINPVFTTHIRTLSNWTYGPSFLKDYPDFEGEVNIGPPRLVR